MTGGIAGKINTRRARRAAGEQVESTICIML
jgi:hypothetical protein